MLEHRAAGAAAQSLDVGGKRPPPADVDRVTAVDGVAQQRIETAFVEAGQSREVVALQPPVPLEQTNDGGPGQHFRGATSRNH